MGGHHMPQQNWIGILVTALAGILSSGQIFAMDVDNSCTGVPCFSDQYKNSGASQDQLMRDMNNSSLPAAQRYSACMASDPRGCDSLRIEAANSGAYMGSDQASGTAPSGSKVSVVKGSLEADCPYVNTGSPAAADTPEESAGANCSAVKSTASTACLTPGTSGMDAGQAAMFTMMTNQMVGLAGQIASAGKNMAQQCRLQADISQAMTAINGIKGTACGVMISQCTKRCEASSEQFKAAADALAQANNMEASEKCRTAARKARVAANQCSSYHGDDDGCYATRTWNRSKQTMCG
jgi:hypothetical protein